MDAAMTQEFKTALENNAKVMADLQASITDAQAARREHTAEEKERLEKWEKALMDVSDRTDQLRKDYGSLSVANNVTDRTKKDWAGLCAQFNDRNGLTAANKAARGAKTIPLDEFTVLQEGLTIIMERRMAKIAVPAEAYLKDRLGNDKFELFDKLRREHDFILQSGVDADGGYLLPEAQAQSIMDEVDVQSNIGAHVTRWHTQMPKVELPAFGYGGTVGYVQENVRPADRPTPKFGTIDCEVHKIYYSGRITEEMLADSIPDIVAYLLKTISRKIANFREEQLLLGTGDTNHAFNGLIQTSTKTTTARTQKHTNDENFRKFYVVKTGGDSKFPHEVEDADKSATYRWLHDDFTNMRDEYLRGAAFYCNRKTRSKLVQIQDDDGRFLVQPDGRAGMSHQLLGYPIRTSDYWPDYNTDGAYGMAFGQMESALWHVIRSGLRMLREDITQPDNVHFYLRCREGCQAVEGASLNFAQFGD